MKQSLLLGRTRANAPSDETAKNAKLLIRAGYVHKPLAGVYNYLPLGWRVIEKIRTVISQEMRALGAEELQLSALQGGEIWRATKRWDLPVWFKTKLQAGGELGLGWSHEEALTQLLVHEVQSYHDLPKALFQFQTKFRNEERAKSGLLRCREFIMKDMYVFCRSEEELNKWYEQTRLAYERIFVTVGLGEKTYLTVASGGDFSRLSHEFQTLTEAGEDVIYFAEEKKIAVNKEVYTDETLAELGLDKAKLKEAKAIEVGNIFPLGTRFATALGLKFKDEAGVSQPVWMGSFGIGLGRLMGAVAEIWGQESAMLWPKSIAPFSIHLIQLPGAEAKAKSFYDDLTVAGLSVLWDDRSLQAGAKFADADLIGLPLRVVVGGRSLQTGNYELLDRATGEAKSLEPVAAKQWLLAHV